MDEKNKEEQGTDICYTIEHRHDDDAYGHNDAILTPPGPSYRFDIYFLVQFQVVSSL